MNATDSYLRHTDKRGHSWLQHHRVWDRDAFLESQLNAAAKEGGKIEVVTEKQYRDYIDAHRK